MPLSALKERINGLLNHPGETGFGWSTTASEVTEGLELDGQDILITGCNSGLGYETMRVLSQHGATVFGTARTRSKADRATGDVDGDAVPGVCDLAAPDTILDCAEVVKSKLDSLDAIICNAGIMALPELHQVHGFEKQFFVNYLGHFLLVRELIDQLDGQARIVTLSSLAHQFAPDAGIQFDNLSGEHGYDPWEAYGQSKLAMLLFARELNRRFREGDGNQTAYAVHPGVIHTNLTRHMGLVPEMVMNVFSKLYLKSIPQGAATQAFAAVHPKATSYSGEYLADCNTRQTSNHGEDLEMAGQLWKETESIVHQLN